MNLRRAFQQMVNGKKMNALMPGGETLLTAAVKSGDAQAAQRFLEQGADIDTPNAQGEFPLFMAIEKGDEKMFRLLVEEGASFKPWRSSLSAEDVAQKHGREDFARIIRAGLSVEDS